MPSSAALAFALAVGFGLVCTRGGRWLANRVGLRDAPDGRRKIHARPVAVVGGLALLVAVVAALAVTALLTSDAADEFAVRFDRLAALAASAVVLAAVGVVDDLRNLRARYKLLGQLAAVMVLIYGGDYRIREVAAFGTVIPLGSFAVPFTIAWFILAINSVNLLDGMDGMLGSVGVVIFLGLAGMAMLSGSVVTVLIAAAAAGALIGFLWFNLPPASVYLGDSGSMLIGLTVATLAIEANLKGPAFAILAPLALFVLPVLDTSAAVIRRKLTGRGLAIGDRGHLHHVLLRRQGDSVPRVLLTVGGFGLLAAAGAVYSTYAKNDVVAVATAAVVAVLLVVLGLFGVAELRLIRARAGSVLRKVQGSGRPVEMEVRLQGTRGWGELWARVVRDAEELGLSSVCLDVNAPAWQEGYHRRWQRTDAADDPLTAWRVELPLVGFGQVVGRLTVSGCRADGSMAEKLAALSQLLLAAERLLTEPPSVQPVAAPRQADAANPLSVTA